MDSSSFIRSPSLDLYGVDGLSDLLKLFAVLGLVGNAEDGLLGFFVAEPGREVCVMSVRLDDWCLNTFVLRDAVA